MKAGNILRFVLRSAAAVYFCVIISLAVATFLSPRIYGSLWFFIIWGLFALTVVIAIISTGMWRKTGSFLIHLSLLAMLGGGLLTWLFQEKGWMKLTPGEEVSVFVSDSGESRPLPSPVMLEKFETVYYPGGEIPRDYVSHILVDGEERVISMNRILDISGYRLSQSSYDDNGGSVLAVGYDPYGLFLSYAGYILFMIGGLWLLLTPNGRYRKLLRSFAIISFVLCCNFTAFCAENLPETGNKINGVPRNHADSLMTKQVVYGGRIVTFNTLSKDIITKLYGKPEFCGLTPEQVLLSFRLFPDDWKSQRLILIKDKSIIKALGLNGRYAALKDLFDEEGNYRVTRLYTTLGGRHSRSIEELDEKVGIILTLLSGKLIIASEGEPLPEWRVKLELFYNSFPATTLIFILLYIAFFISALGLISKRVTWYFHTSSVILIVCALAVSSLNFIIQWILSERCPVSNTFETLQFAVLIIEIGILFMFRRDRLLLTLSTLGGGSLALVAHLTAMNPVVTPLMPVLHSPWLSLHVSLVMTAYVLLGFTFILSVAYFVGGDRDGRLYRLSLLLLYPGVWLLGGGIFSGAVWAEISWGDYWSWDPKETWALITLLVYAFPLHRSFCRIPNRIFNPINKSRYSGTCVDGIKFNERKSHFFFHLYLLVAILSIAMTYFGVNHLNSMHAYG